MERRRLQSLYLKQNNYDGDKECGVGMLITIKLVFHLNH